MESVTADGNVKLRKKQRKKKVQFISQILPIPVVHVRLPNYLLLSRTIIFGDPDFALVQRNNNSTHKRALIFPLARNILARFTHTSQFQFAISRCAIHWKNMYEN